MQLNIPGQTPEYMSFRIPFTLYIDILVYIHGFKYVGYYDYNNSKLGQNIHIILRENDTLYLNCYLYIL